MINNIKAAPGPSLANIAQKPRQSKPIAADYLSSNSSLSNFDKARIFFGSTGAGTMTSAGVALVPSAVMYGAGAVLNKTPLTRFADTTMLSSLASGVVVGALSSQVRSGSEGALLGAVVGAGVGVAAGAFKAGLTGALVNGAIGGLSGMAGGYISSSVHSGYQW